MKAFISYYFLSQRYELADVLFVKMENDLKHGSPDAIHATHHSQKIGNHLEVRYNTPHFTAVIIALNSNYKLELAAIHITLKRSTSKLKVII